MEIKTLNEQIERLRGLIRKCYGAVAGKNGAVPEVGERNMENLPAAIGSIKEEIPEVEEKEVNFYDYKGKRVFSYSAEEAMNLTELPVASSDEWVQFYGWSEPLEKIREGLPLDVGAYYDLSAQMKGEQNFSVVMLARITDSVELVLQDSIAPQGKIELVDWGDGTMNANLSHTYTDAGMYIIRVKVYCRAGNLGYNIVDNKISSPKISFIRVHSSIDMQYYISLRGGIRNYSDMEYYTTAGTAQYECNYQSPDSAHVRMAVLGRFINYSHWVSSNSVQKIIIPSCFGVNGRQYNISYYPNLRYVPHGFDGWAAGVETLVIPASASRLRNAGNADQLFLYCPIPPSVYDDRKFISHIPIGSLADYLNATNYTKVTFVEDIPTTINSFSITADDVAAGATTTTIHVSANVSMKAMWSNTMVPRSFTREVVSSEFEPNTSTEPREIEISFTMLGETRTCTITQAGVTT